MERAQLYSVLFDQQKDFAEMRNFVPRELTSTLLPLFHLRLPLVITGVRRAGKSTLLKIVKNELQLPEKASLYLNFNDERLISFALNDFQKITDFLQEQNYQEKCYLFIDEIQEVEKWEKWIDRIKEKHLIVITGSNSKLLSKEISTILTGRSVSLSLYPFSFREFLNFKNIDVGNASLDLKVQSLIRREFTFFLNMGGIPQVITAGEERLLAELYENILYRDIIKRFDAHLEKPIKEISLLLLSNISKEASLRSVSQSSGITNLSTVKSILDTFEKAFLFYFINKFDFSLRKQLQNPRKVYCVDNGFVTKIGFRLSEDKGRLFENLVFIELKRRNKEIYYFREQGECDFVLKEGIAITEALQVCYQLNQDNREREVKGLNEALQRFNLKQGLLLTLDQEEEIETERGKIKVLPVWKWLLNEAKATSE